MERNVIVCGDLRYHLVPKVASSTLSVAVNNGSTNRKAYPWEEGPEYRFMVVRHPLDRIVSFYSFFCKSENWITRVEPLGYKLNMPFEECVELLLEKYEQNSHSQKQVDFKGPHEIDLLVKLENLNTCWPELQSLFPWLRSLGHFKKTDHQSWQWHFGNRKLRTKAEDTFTEDIVLYEGAK